MQFGFIFHKAHNIKEAFMMILCSEFNFTFNFQILDFSERDISNCSCFYYEYAVCSILLPLKRRKRQVQNDILLAIKEYM